MPLETNWSSCSKKARLGIMLTDRLRKNAGRLFNVRLFGTSVPVELGLLPDSPFSIAMLKLDNTI